MVVVVVVMVVVVVVMMVTLHLHSQHSWVSDKKQMARNRGGLYHFKKMSPLNFLN